MNKKESSTKTYLESSIGFRQYYGKLYGALLNKFGASHIHLIEDAIQTAFYKSLKTWKPDRKPDNKENWLFIVARNDLINHLKTKRKTTVLQTEMLSDLGHQPTGEWQEDPRLSTLIFLTKFQKTNKISDTATIIFILKNIFGFHIKEIGASTLMTSHALYKSIKRTQTTLKQLSPKIDFDHLEGKANIDEIKLIEEVLYAIFNIGFDQFDASSDKVVNQDICMEALSLAKLLGEKYQQPTTHHLIALCCFHLARIPAKMNSSKIVSFFKQDQSKWSKPLIDLGFHYLQKPIALNKYYLEALIVSKHMINPKIDRQHWQEISKLYELLLRLQPNPIVQLNYCYSLFKAEEKEQVLTVLNKVSQMLPKNHVYLSLIKATILKQVDAEKSAKLFRIALGQIKQKIRKDHILGMMNS